MRRALLAVGAFASLAACGAGAVESEPGDAARAEANAGGTQARSAQVGKVDLHWLEAGPTDGLPVVLLHGAKYTAQTWRELGTLELLAAQGFRVLALDLPGGLGATPSAECDASTFLGEVLTVLELERPVVVAPSMSGRFALPFAARAPERLAGFVPVAPANIEAFRAELAGARVPTLVVWGSADEIVPVEQAEQLRSALPDARVLLLEGAGHACYLDAPEAFHTELAAFLQSLRAK